MRTDTEKLMKGYHQGTRVFACFFYSTSQKEN